ncbi:biliverdin-producing heme oxygenase [Novosphingobium sp. PP1Y]|uniref:biliverdin-producing heme oxygenase n=1 Tax=Novosphingobium sp. PP1Y TaxID=702113 RepID=UPI001E3A7ACC|nr:biliverdin-producing heme oxygenase [Novosphingobium sp. PP1Y]
MNTKGCAMFPRQACGSEQTGQQDAVRELRRNISQIYEFNHTDGVPPVSANVFAPKVESTMCAAMNNAEAPDMLAELRAATAQAHARLDGAFGALDLSERDGLARFLSAHAIGLGPLFPVFRNFVESELGMNCPDYPAMLSEDLRSLGNDPDDLPQLAVDPALQAPSAPVGVGYVVAGSRLGMAVLRKQGYWGEQSTSATPGRYMEDESGHAVWKTLMPWLKGRTFDQGEREAVTAAALAAFSSFASAFAVSAGRKNTIETGADG